jgi:p-cumate 2,3-dioxygenase alpha subunit
MDASDLVVENVESGSFRVRRDAYTSAEIFDLEQERVFDRSWLYLGHESEVRESGDFVCRSVGRRSVVLSRDEDGALHALVNTCPHRGAAVCRLEAGNARFFQCFYHAWTFANDGSLASRPGEDAYGPGAATTALGLVELRHASYKGFVFVNPSGDAPDLATYLGDAGYYLDLVADQAAEGMCVLPGSQRYEISANWKLMAENSVDGYHTVPMHATYFMYAAKVGGRKTRGTGPGYSRNLGNGHGVMAVCSPYGRPGSRWVEMFGEGVRDEIDRSRAWMYAAHDHHKAFEMAEVTRNVWFFPNLIINDGVAITIRKIDPVAVDRMVVTAWALGPVGESEALTKTRLSSFLTFYGPGGFAHPDDIEALESCQAGYAAPDVMWSDFSRGMLRRHGSATSNLDEGQIRSFWREWSARLDGRPSPDQEEARWPPDLDTLETANHDIEVASATSG